MHEIVRQSLAPLCAKMTGSQLRDLPYSFRPTEMPHGRWRSMSVARMRSNMALSKRKCLGRELAGSTNIWFICTIDAPIHTTPNR